MDVYSEGEVEGEGDDGDGKQPSTVALMYPTKSLRVAVKRAHGHGHISSAKRTAYQLPYIALSAA